MITTYPKSAQLPTELPIDSLVESKTNPRRTFNPGKLAELAHSAKQLGMILEPLLVRPKDGKHEIVAGARRYRAAKMAELTVLPVRIMELTDEQALEIQIVENLQREDPHPLEEAEGYSRLLKMESYTVEILAEKVGKTPSYIYKRLQLSHLIKPAKEAFLEGRINIGHALFLCRLPEASQKLAFEECFPSSWNGSKRVHDTKDKANISAKELADWIRDHILLELSAAPWKKDDATLVPKAGPCTTCQKRTGSNAALFDDFKKGDQCLDGECYERKRDAFVKIQISATPDLPKITLSYGETPAGFLPRERYQVVSKSDKCKHAEPAIVAAGDRQVGHKILICRTAECKKHNQFRNSSFGKESSFAEVWADKKRNLGKKIEWETRLRVFLEVLARPLKWDVPSDQLRIVAHALLGYSTPPPEVVEGLKIPAAAGRDLKNGSAVSKFIEGMIDAPDGSPASDFLPRIILALSIQEIPKEYCREETIKRLKLAAQACGVKWDEIAKKVSADLNADFAKKKAKAEARQKEIKAKAAKA